MTDYDEHHSYDQDSYDVGPADVATDAQVRAAQAARASRPTTCDQPCHQGSPRSTVPHAGWSPERGWHDAIAPEPSYVHEARYLGAAAAMAAASWLEIPEDDARSILTDVDPLVMDQYAPPNLSGEWADDPTSDSLWREITGADEALTDDAQFAQVDAIADAWQEGCDLVWSDALQAHALRVLGEHTSATQADHALAARVTELRELAR